MNVFTPGRRISQQWTYCETTNGYASTNQYNLRKAEEMPDLSAGVDYWQFRYDRGHTEWQLPYAYPTLVKHYDKLNPDGAACKVFYPMCGLSLDMAWLIEQGMTVVGVELVPHVLRMLVSDGCYNWSEAPVPSLGPEATVVTRSDNRMRIYCGDMQEYTPEIEGRFDFIWDRGSIQYVRRENVQRYARSMKNLLNPGGRLLLVVVEYDLNILQDKDFRPSMKVPPPYSMSPLEIKELYEPECTVEHIEQYATNGLFGKQERFHVYLVIKK
ncbi:thiopurine s-methyltransferase [Plakobranchus ocellatus]|uniref:Thiopurine s-methyltransferase n=1 Tax=Plakobranchus ocellatus TaxID=259542 RepID=A0AAV3Y6D7_9GAST|nr:thiopurine s-methyltransferase [Plakobranchus ocellatus]